MPSDELNLQAAREALGGDEELLQIVVRAFLEESPELLASIRQAVEEGDANRVRISAHALKGSIRYFGETPAYQLAYELETAAAAGDIANAMDTVTQLSEATDVLRAQLIPLTDETS